MDLDDDYLDQLAHDCLRQAYHAAAAAVKEARSSHEDIQVIAHRVVASLAEDDQMQETFISKLSKHLKSALVPIIEKELAGSTSADGGTMMLTHAKALITQRPEIQRLLEQSRIQLQEKLATSLVTASEEWELPLVPPGEWSGMDEGEDESFSVAGAGGGNGGRGGFVSLFSLHDLPDIIMVDMANVAMKLKSQDTLLRLEALDELKNSMLSELTYSEKWPDICSGLAGLLSYPEQSVQLKVIELFKEFFTCLTPIQCGDIYLSLAIDLVQCFKNKVRCLPVGTTFDLKYKGSAEIKGGEEVRSLCAKVKLLHKMQGRMAGFFPLLSEQVISKIVGWTLILLHCVTLPQYLHHDLQTRLEGREGTILGAAHFWALLDIEASWFRTWCLRLPQQQLLYLLKRTGFVASLIYCCQTKGDISTSKPFQTPLKSQANASSSLKVEVVILKDGSEKAVPVAISATDTDGRQRERRRKKRRMITKDTVAHHLHTNSLWMLAHVLQVGVDILGMPSTSTAADAVPSLFSVDMSVSDLPGPDDIRFEPVQVSNMTIYHVNVIKRQGGQQEQEGSPESMMVVAQDPETSSSINSHGPLSSCIDVIMQTLYCSSANKEQDQTHLLKESMIRAAIEGLLNIATATERSLSNNSSCRFKLDLLMEVFGKLASLAECKYDPLPASCSANHGQEVLLVLSAALRMAIILLNVAGVAASSSPSFQFPPPSFMDSFASIKHAVLILMYQEEGAVPACCEAQMTGLIGDLCATTYILYRRHPYLSPDPATWSIHKLIAMDTKSRAAVTAATRRRQEIVCRCLSVMTWSFRGIRYMMTTSMLSPCVNFLVQDVLEPKLQMIMPGALQQKQVDLNTAVYSLTMIASFLQLISCTKEGASAIVDTGLLDLCTNVLLDQPVKLFGVRLTEYLSHHHAATQPQALYWVTFILSSILRGFTLALSHSLNNTLSSEDDKGGLRTILEKYVGKCVHIIHQRISLRKDEDEVEIALRLLIAVADTPTGAAYLLVSFPELLEDLSNLIQSPVDGVGVAGAYLRSLLVEGGGVGKHDAICPPLRDEVELSQAFNAINGKKMEKEEDQEAIAMDQHTPPEDLPSGALLPSLTYHDLEKRLMEGQIDRSQLMVTCWQALSSWMIETYQLQDASELLGKGGGSQSVCMESGGGAAADNDGGGSFAKRMLLRNIDMMGQVAAHHFKQDPIILKKHCMQALLKNCSSNSGTKGDMSEPLSETLMASVCIMAAGAADQQQQECQSPSSIFFSCLQQILSTETMEKELADLTLELVCQELPQVAGALELLGFSLNHIIINYLHHWFWTSPLDLPEMFLSLTLSLIKGRQYQVFTILALLKHLQPAILHASAHQLDILHLFQLFRSGGGHRQGGERGEPTALLANFVFTSEVMMYMKELEQRYYQQIQQRLAATSATSTTHVAYNNSS